MAPQFNELSHLLGDRDCDAHTPLVIEVHANQFIGGRMGTMNRNPGTLLEAADRRKARQKANKARGSVDPAPAAPTEAGSPQGEGVSGAPSLGSTSSRTRTNFVVAKPKAAREASPPKARRPPRQEYREELSRF